MAVLCSEMKQGYLINFNLTGAVHQVNAII